MCGVRVGRGRRTKAGATHLGAVVTRRQFVPAAHRLAAGAVHVLQHVDAAVHWQLKVRARPAVVQRVAVEQHLELLLVRHQVQLHVEHVPPGVVGQCLDEAGLAGAWRACQKDAQRAGHAGALVPLGGVHEVVQVRAELRHQVAVEEHVVQRARAGERVAHEAAGGWVGAAGGWVLVEDPEPPPQPVAGLQAVLSTQPVHKALELRRRQAR